VETIMNRRTVCLLMLGMLAIRADAQTSTTEEKPFLSPLFSDNMVLQRDVPAPIWGWTTPGAEVRVTLGGDSLTTKAGDDGKWMLKLPAHKAGGEYSLAVAGTEKITLRNITFGDVWLCSGQSNMEWGVKLANNPDAEIAAANHPNLRLFTVAKRPSYAPVSGVLKDPEKLFGVWSVCTPETIAKGGGMGFSAVAYYFGRELVKETGVPIGLLHSSWGGTIAEAWVSADSLKAMPAFSGAVSQAEEAAKQGTAVPNNNPNIVTVLNNGMINPLVPFAIKGAIWYQGESNAGRAIQYRTLLPTLIADWRKQFGVGDFPFYIVQLANFMAKDAEPKSDPWPLLREAQTLTANSVKNSGLAVAIDIGDEKDIHPKNKQEVGRRLALNALAKTYKKKVDFSGPTYRRMERRGNAIRIRFDHARGGLMTTDGSGKVQGFAIAGEDRKFHWADATIDGDSVIVSSPNVANPIAVRYAWANNPTVNLYNKANLPTVPFRTDNWE
jgi:sialate O-acetylesterase